MPHIPLSPPCGSDQNSGDFVLFGDGSLYAPYRIPHFSSLPGNDFQNTASDVAFPVLDAHMPDELQNHDTMRKQFYSLESTSELPMASSSPQYESLPAYNSFNEDDIPRSYMNHQHMSSAPNVLIHPPTLPPYNSARLPLQTEYCATPTASPATSIGAFEGSGSGISGSESGSTRHSPYHTPISLEDSLRGFCMDTSFADTSANYPHLQLALTLPPGINPTLVTNTSPSFEREDPLSTSPYGSPSWHSPSAISSSPASPDLHRHSSGRLSPSTHHSYSRHAPYPQRRPSTGSIHSRMSLGSPSMRTLDSEDMYSTTTEIISYQPVHSPSQRSTTSQRRSPEAGKEGKDTVCPECAKSFRDLRAHQLTHQLERPEKCPIATCEYSKKGFARKYDCQRHTLTHYKGMMVCGFCPGTGSAMEKSFNRADVFKRHLMAVHNVEQTAPNGRTKKKKGIDGGADEDFSSPYLSGKCSTCSVTFPTAQQFYEHLDECVLSKVVEDEPAAAANEKNLAMVKLEELDASGVSDDEDECSLPDVEEAYDDEDKDETYAGGKRSKSSRLPTTRSKSKKQR